MGAWACVSVARCVTLGCAVAADAFAGCCTAAGCGALFPALAEVLAGLKDRGAGGLAALGELLLFPRLGLLRAAFSARARRSCSACVAMALQTLSLTIFHKASCSSALANSSIRTGAP